MPKPQEVEAITIHCTAGFGSIESIKKYWKEVLGWKSPGYHIIIDLYGKLHIIAPFENYTNGVKGKNGKLIHISYIGGVEKKGNKYIGKDTRNEAQKRGIIEAIEMAQEWLAKNGICPCKIPIKGHRDFSPDLNKNGIIDSWERIKECPSFDAIPEYKNLTTCKK